jgi:hypothetical protein
MAFLCVPINTVASLETKNFATESIALCLPHEMFAYSGVKFCLQ